MLYLLITVILNVGIFTVFRLFQRFNADTLQSIVFNYFTCVLFGIFIVGPKEVVSFLDTPWIGYAIFLGCLFIGTFYLMARTTAEISMSVSSIASKMSLIIPVLLSLFVFNIESQGLDLLNITGLILGLISIVLVSDKKGKIKTSQFGWLILPMLVFVLSGILDSTINYINYNFIKPDDVEVFPVFVFLTAGTIGAMVLIFRRTKFKFINLAIGFVLGIINYYSIVFVLLALEQFNNDGAFFYPVLNMAIVAGSAIISVVLFKEQFSQKNKIGLVLSFLALILLSYKEILK